MLVWVKCSINGLKSLAIFLFFFLMGLGFELRALKLAKQVLCHTSSALIEHFSGA
jgi:hypothetical protein